MMMPRTGGQPELGGPPGPGPNRPVTVAVRDGPGPGVRRSQAAGTPGEGGRGTVTGARHAVTVRAGRAPGSSSGTGPALARLPRPLSLSGPGPAGQ
jgi:hypothetical protein